MFAQWKFLGSLALVGVMTTGCAETNILEPADDTTYVAPDDADTNTNMPVDRDEARTTREDVTVLKPDTSEPLIPPDTTTPENDDVTPTPVEPGNTGNETGYEAPRAEDNPQVQPAEPLPN